MNNLVLAVGYVVVVLHEFWYQEKSLPVGTVLEVTRTDRNSLVSGRVARDATDVEIAEFRGTPLPEEALPDEDESEAIAGLAAAQAKLQALEAERASLQSSVQDLTAEKAELVKTIGELNAEVDKLQAANAAQAKALKASAK